MNIKKGKELEQDEERLMARGSLEEKFDRIRKVALDPTVKDFQVTITRKGNRFHMDIQEEK